jgi:iron(II)-dependent oxidoreductase
MAEDREKPQHEVVLPAFRIGKHPVTNAQYGRFAEATGRRWRGEPEQANCPVVNVSWHEARAYCAWLTEVWREEGRIDAGEVVRLPTEAEWEKAARGTDGRLWPWGDAWDDTRCNTRESELGGACAVGLFPESASPYGCLDIAGQVWEWTLSLWGKDLKKPDYVYPYDWEDGRENTEADDEMRRVLRGGSWPLDRRRARCASRRGSRPHLRSGYFGFRVVVSPASPASAL